MVPGTYGKTLVKEWFGFMLVHSWSPYIDIIPLLVWSIKSLRRDVFSEGRYVPAQESSASMWKLDITHYTDRVGTLTMTCRM